MPRAALAEADIPAHKSPRQAKKEAIVETVAERVSGRMSIGSMTDKLFDLRDQKREYEAKIKVIEAEYETINEALMAAAEREGIDKGTGKKATFSISRAVVANTTDWEELNAWIKKTGNFQLYQRRLSDPAYRELLELGKKVPGVEPFTKARINLRSLTP